MSWPEWEPKQKLYQEPEEERAVPLLGPVIPLGDEGVGHEVPASRFGLHVVCSRRWAIRAVNA